MCDTAGEAVAWTGARLVTYGLIPGSFTPSVESCERAVSPATKAVIVPHLYGIPADVRGFARLADRHHLLLVEDSALRLPVSEEAILDYDSPAGCVLHSFNYGKPLSLGWGGIVSLTRSLAADIGLPDATPMAEPDDRFYAAAMLLGHVVTDSAGLRDHPVRADAGLHLLTKTGGGRRSAVPDWNMMEEVLGAATSGPLSFMEWYAAHAARVRPAAGGVSSPSRIGRLLEHARAVVAAGAHRLRSRLPAGSAGPMESLRSGGYSERLLETQWRLLANHASPTSRSTVAALYAATLDPDTWVFPPADQASHWLSYPVAAKSALQRDRLVRTAAEHLGVDIFPYVWPEVLHRVPHLRHAVVPGPGSRETACLVDGLLNLPVHAQMPLERAAALVDLLNSAVGRFLG
jgi:dTDP-4-amino-4,6-dideoxygalactose transaminase